MAVISIRNRREWRKCVENKLEIIKWGKKKQKSRKEKYVNRRQNAREHPANAPTRLFPSLFLSNKKEIPAQTYFVLCFFFFFFCIAAKHQTYSRFHFLLFRRFFFHPSAPSIGLMVEAYHLWLGKPHFCFGRERRKNKQERRKIFSFLFRIQSFWLSFMCVMSERITCAHIFCLCILSLSVCRFIHFFFQQLSTHVIRVRKYV